MPSMNKNIIRFDASDFLSGLSPQYVTSLGATPDTFTGKLNLASAFHPYRSLGYAAPGFQATDLTNVSAVTGILRNVCTGAESSTAYAYAIGDNELLHRIDISNKTVSNAGSWPHSITGAGAETGNDCIMYNTNIGSTRTACVFYSWNDSGGAWNVGIFNTSASTFDDDWMTTIPASPLTASGNNKPHPMVIGADDVLYIADGNVLHGMDGGNGANGTFETTLLTLPSGYIITTMAKTPDYLAVFAYYAPGGNSVSPSVVTSGPAICVLWNYLDEDPTYVIPLNDNVVTASFEFSGTVGCLTQGTKPFPEGENRFCTLQVLNGLSFEIKKVFIGNPPIHGGVEVIDDSIQWNSDGAVHCYGTPLLDTPPGLNKLNVGSGTTSGLLRTIGGLTGFQLISSGATTSGGAQYMKVGTYSSAALLQTGAISPDVPPDKIWKITRVGVRFGKTVSTGRSLSLYLQKENAVNTQVLSALTSVTSSTINTFYDRDINGNMFGQFQELSLVLQWQGGLAETDAPVVRFVDVYCEVDNLIK